MKRSLKLASLVIAPLAAIGVTVAVASPATASIDLGGGARSYVLTRVLGPFEGHTWIDSEAATAHCNNPNDSILSGKATIDHKTSHGTSKKDVVTLSVLGAFYDPEDTGLKWGTFIEHNGNDGWNTVIISITCRTTNPKPAT